MTDKPTVTRETFDSLSQKGRDGVLYDYMAATYTRLERLEDKADEDCKKATRAGAAAGFIGGVGTVLMYITSKIFGASW